MTFPENNLQFTGRPTIFRITTGKREYVEVLLPPILFSSDVKDTIDPVKKLILTKIRQRESRSQTGLMVQPSEEAITNGPSKMLAKPFPNWLVNPGRYTLLPGLINRRSAKSHTQRLPRPRT
jgi:hypothetical protein